MCKALQQEFPDISISKIRYLEDQKLLSPRRTQGGYRLYTQSDVQRLRTILRLQRDEFLPLRVIRQELAGGRGARGGTTTPAPSDGRSLRRAQALVSTRDPGALYSLEDVVEETGADAGLVRELVEFGVIKGEMRAGVRYFDETEREIVRAVSELARYGVGGTQPPGVPQLGRPRGPAAAEHPRARPCARATRSAAARRSRRSRTWPR